MSDTSQGPGWWQASDGKWYAPELYPKDWPKPNPTPDASAEEAAPTSAATESMPVVEPEQSAPVVSEPVVETPPAAATESVPVVETPSTPPATPDPAVSAAAEWAGPANVPISAEPESASAFGAPTAEPDPNQWGGTDPAAGEPTLVTGVPPVVQPEAQQPAAFPPQQPVQQAPQQWQQPAPTEPLGQPPMAPAGAAAASSADAPSGILAILGGIALVVGSFLAWATAAGTLTSGNVNGLSGSNGWGTLICGLAVASGAALLLAGLRAWWVGAGMAVAALVAIGLVIFSITDIGSTSDDLPGVLRDAGVEEVTAAGAKLDLDIGIWIVAAGAAVSLIAGIVALVRRQG